MGIRPRNARRFAGWTAAVVGLLVLLALATLATPLEQWRTGRLPVEPLPLVDGGPAVELSRRVWIDTDAACGEGRTTDPDDCLAILMLLRSPSVDVAGISTVHGNAPLPVTDRVTRELVARVAAGEDVAPPPVYRGAAHPLAAGAAPTPAREAMARALAGGPVTIVALGPVTNLAAVLGARPELKANVARVAAVMGRRRGHIFHPAEGEGERAMLLGHGPVFRDFNFAMDPLAARRVLGLRLPLTLTPYEAARRVSVSAHDLAAMTAAGGAASWIAQRSGAWLDYWREDIGRDGFYPFDAMAAAWVLRPDLLDCAAVTAWVGEDPMIHWAPSGPLHLLAGHDHERPADALVEAPAVYCPEVDPGLHDELIAMLSRSAPGGDPPTTDRRTRP